MKLSQRSLLLAEIARLKKDQARDRERHAGEIADLAMLLRRTLRKLHPCDKLRTDALDYLKVIGQAGDPLRNTRPVGRHFSP